MKAIDTLRLASIIGGKKKKSSKKSWTWKVSQFVSGFADGFFS